MTGRHLLIAICLMTGVFGLVFLLAALASGMGVIAMMGSLGVAVVTLIAGYVASRRPSHV